MTVKHPFVAQALAALSDGHANLARLAHSHGVIVESLTELGVDPEA